MNKCKKIVTAFCCGVYLLMACCGCKQESPPEPMKSVTNICGEYALTCDIPEDWEVFSCTQAGISLIPSSLLNTKDYNVLSDIISILRYDFSLDEKSATEALFQGDTESFQTFTKQIIEKAAGYKVEHFSYSFDDTNAGKLVTVRYDLTVPEETFVVYHYIECYLEGVPYCVSGTQNTELKISPDLLVPWIAKTLKCTVENKQN